MFREAFPSTYITETEKAEIEACKNSEDCYVLNCNTLCYRLKILLILIQSEIISELQPFQ